MRQEFTDYCKQYYELWLQWNELERRYDYLVENALTYTNQTMANELDAIIGHHRRIEKARAAADECGNKLSEISGVLDQIFAYFEIPPHTGIFCEVPGFYELVFWADDDNRVNCIKLQDFAPIEADLNIITIQLNYSKNEWEDNVYDEDDF